MKFLQIENVSKRFTDLDAVSDITFEINEGEFLTLLGPSGCGKSTLLRMIAGLERPSAGRMLFKGEDITRLSPDARPFNMVFQSYALFPHLSVAGNIAYGPRTAGRDPRETSDRVAEMLELVHMEGQGDRPIEELSGGQQQRVALARALINDPAVLLLDEPLGALDLQLRKRLQHELRSIQKRLGNTFIYVTHDQEEALTLSDRIALMQDGRIVQVGDPRSVYERPSTRFAADFIGEANLVDCSVVEVLGETVKVAFENGSTCALPHRGSMDLDRGSRVVAVLRPQHLELCDRGAGPFEGVIDETVFLGDYNRHELKVDGGLRLRLNSDVDGPALNGHAIGIRVRDGHGTVVKA